jgi:peptidoglycan/LPS O-acetylase OafA/YrhL
MGRAENYLVAMMLSILIGYLSWILVERPSISFGKRLTVLLKNNHKKYNRDIYDN